MCVTAEASLPAELAEDASISDAKGQSRNSSGKPASDCESGSCVCSAAAALC